MIGLRRVRARVKVRVRSGVRVWRGVRVVEYQEDGYPWKQLT